MRDQVIVAAFGGKILGVRNYKSEKKEFFVGDFRDLAVLKDFLREVSTGESDITPAGKVFLEKYYRFEDLALEIASKGDFCITNRPSSFEEILKWVKELQPMETTAFIEEARGNIEPSARLRSDLLPPKEV
jgi:hypothetical protein